ncbi:DUF768 domain-containing protein [Sphingomonas suaedae]|uniref:DUF768 domain-containing protein n=1 Tax=Sphingomonas suaedae TaxID=2599297 RepID=UPI0016492714|nr:DUF768 domain-containing protein [Sphingomonas suaedae]
MSERSDRFVRAWVSDNVHNIPGLDDYQLHCEELAEKLKDAAQARGIMPDELAESIGDSYDFMINEYEQIRDPDLGFKDGRD